MITIILPGYSPKNKEWAHEVKNNLKLNHKAIVHEWGHWSKGSFSFRGEIEEIVKNTKGETINIIAKSVGTRVTMHLVGLMRESIEKVILCGIPTKLQTEDTQKLYEKGFKILDGKKTICFQNTKDPFANYKVIRNFVKLANPSIKVIEGKRSDHHYPYYKDFQEFLASKKNVS